jgi:hypothetical protein
MDVKTASAEHKTPKIPFNAQYHGVWLAARDRASFMPVGKKKPRSIPSGKINAMETAILPSIGEVIMPDSTGTRKMRIMTIASAVAKGKTYFQGERVNGRCSLTKLPQPVLRINVKRRIPRAYTG